MYLVSYVKDGLKLLRYMNQRELAEVLLQENVHLIRAVETVQHGEK